MANVSSSNGLEKRPKLRFPGFDEPWEDTLFSDLYEAANEKNDGSFGVESIISVANMYFKEDARITDEGYLKTYNIFKVGDIAFEGNKSNDFSHGRFVENTIGDGIVSHVFVVFKPLHDTHNLRYWKYAINNESVMGRILARCTKKTTMMTNLVTKDFLNQSIPCPSAQEQDKIASLLDTISKRIELQKLYVESLKKYKRGAIAHILSGKDSEFAGEAIWAEKALSDLCCEFRSGRSISATLIHESGDYPVYGGNGIRGYCDHYSHEGEYVVVGRQGALCGNVRLIRGQNYLSEHAIAVRANEENDTKFLLYLLDFMNLGQYSDQGAQPGLAVNKLLRLKCNVPEKKIQSKISAFLLTYDKQIAFQESILSLLTAQRKAFLQQLFI